MWRNYLTVAIRTLARNRVYAFINIVGLTVGLAACVLILLYVRYERSYDNWMGDAAQVYQLQSYELATGRNTEQKKQQLSAVVAGRALQKDFPQVEKVVWMRAFSPIVIQDGQPAEAPRLRMVNDNIFDVFDMPFARGSARTALPDTHSIAISESEARRRFGDADPIGKTLTIIDNTGDVDYRVTAVYKDIPRNSSLSADMFARFDMEAQFGLQPGVLTRWQRSEGWNFVKLRKGADADVINAELTAWKKRNIPDEIVNGERSNPGSELDFKLVNIRSVHLGAAQLFAQTPGNDNATVTTFGVIALLVVGMASINFTNLATARASLRAREVALRKVLGATRGQLIAQFLTESIMLALLAMLGALTLVELLLPAFNRFLETSITIHYWGADSIWLPVLVLIMFVGVAGGLYPAFYLSRFQPAKILKANKSAANASGSGGLRNVLVIAQFAVSIGLIACTAITYAQTRYAQTLDAGYQRDGLLQVGNLDFRGVTDAQGLAFVDRVRRLPGVEAAGGTQIGIAPHNSSTADFFLPGAANSAPLGAYGVETGFLEAMKMRLLAGRFFADAQGKDDATTPYPVDLNAERALAARGINVVVTEAAAKRLGFRTPQEAIGKLINGAITASDVGLIPCTIVGVVSDARLRSLREPIQPTVYVMQKTSFAQVAVRFSGIAPRDIRSSVEKVWRQLIPLVPFKADFADDIVRAQYRQETARGAMFAVFSVLTVAIGCLGLFGLAAFTAERRTKEIGIRKVLGARTRDILHLLVWQFSRPVLLANVIAWPIAWWLMRDWLNGFDTRVALTPIPFAAAGLVAIVIAIVTVAGQALRVARLNPIHALRYE